jgi:hypothetical protein
MDVNNNTEINKMFGTEDNPVTPPAEPELKSSPLEEEAVGASSFQDSSQGSSVSNSISGKAEFGGGNHDGGESMPEFSETELSNQGITIGNHEGFGFAQKGGLKTPVVLVLVMFVVGIALGGFAMYAHLFGLNISANDRAAKTAMEAVVERIEKISDTTPENIIFAGVYVHSRTDSFDCMLITLIEEEPGRFTNASFQVLIDKDGGDSKVFGEFEPEKYDELMEGEDEDRIQAQILLNRHEEFMKNLGEIRGEHTNWRKIDTTFLGVRILTK